MPSVIICTHNPRGDYLHRTLEGLKAQTSRKEAWELLLIDNHSDQPLLGRFDLSWHPNGRIVREDELGLTPARLRGVRESQSELLVFVDDDNVLDPNYLAEAAAIHARLPQIGAFGGSIVPEFETPPPPQTEPLWPSLALRSVTEDRWASFVFYPTPCGAGLCLKKAIALRYAETLKSSPLRRLLDRKGSSLASAGDIDMIMTAPDTGYGVGVFAALKLTHLIDARRCSESYLLRLEENIICSETLLAYARGGSPHKQSADGRSAKRRIFSSVVETAERFLASDIQRKRIAAHERGRQAAIEKILEAERANSAEGGA